MEQLGRAKSVKVQKENTIIVDGMGDKDAIPQGYPRFASRSRKPPLI